MYIIIFPFIFHPFILTAVLAVIVIWACVKYNLWRRYKRLFVIGLAVAIVALAFDTMRALERIKYAHNLPTEPVVHKTVPLPARLILVGNSAKCEKQCHEMLLSGELEEVILPPPRRSRWSGFPAIRYRVGWSVPGACPQDRLRVAHMTSRQSLSSKGFCPEIEGTEIPVEGIFVVHESLGVQAKKRARYIQPKYSGETPPGPVIKYTAMEVQERQSGETSVLAYERRYVAPSHLGPLIGCWNRPANVIWIMPGGDTGCGLWRLMTGGGSRRPHQWNMKWVFSDVFGATDRKIIKPAPRNLEAPSPSDAIRILKSLDYDVDDVSTHLPPLKDTLLGPSVSDDTLVDLVVHFSQLKRGRLEGSLIALLADSRPSAALAVPAAIDGSLEYVVDPSSIIERIRRDATFRTTYADLMFKALSAVWHPRESKAAFIKLIAKEQPDWFCKNVDQVPDTGGILYHNGKLAFGWTISRTSPMLYALADEAVARCGEAGPALLGKLLRLGEGTVREHAIRLVLRQPDRVSAQVSDHAFANLVDDGSMQGRVFEKVSRNQFFLNAHLRLLRKAGQTCAEVLERLQSFAGEQRRKGQPVAEQIQERIEFLRQPTQFGLWACNDE